MASTIYGKNAVVSPVTPQMFVKGKAAVVNVNKPTVGILTPPVPSIDLAKYGDKPPPSPTFSVGSTFINTASSANPAKPQLVRLGSGNKVAQVSSVEVGKTSRQMRDSNAITIIEDSPVDTEGPFADPVATSPTTSNVSAAIEEATRKATSDVRAGLGKSRHTETPFGDENEAQ